MEFAGAGGLEVPGVGLEGWFEGQARKVSDKVIGDGAL